MFKLPFKAKSSNPTNIGKIKAPKSIKLIEDNSDNYGLNNIADKTLSDPKQSKLFYLQKLRELDNKIEKMEDMKRNSEGQLGKDKRVIANNTIVKLLPIMEDISSHLTLDELKSSGCKSTIFKNRIKK